MTDPTTEAYAELQTAYTHNNQALFAGKLPSCLITLQREKRAYGYFSAKRFVHRSDKMTTDEIAINPSYFAVLPLVEVMQTLVHEMVHAWQYHFGKPVRRCYHNREWADKMESIGLMPSSTGKPGGARTGERMSDYPIEGGAFLRATEQLLDQAFRISWLDRCPPASHAHVLSGSSASGEVVAAASELISNHAAALTLPMGQNADGSPVTGEFLEVIVSPRPINRSNRVKYRCPNCQAQAWGKPLLRLRCGEDDCEGAEFEVVEV